MNGSKKKLPGRSRAGLTYKDAGVDLDAAARAKSRLVEIVGSTYGKLTVSGAGGFGGVHALPSGMRRPLLVSSADGVGTKLRLAFESGRHDTVGQCLVNHCVNDILVQGARPLFFMDYLAMGRLDEEVVADVVGGVARACRANSTSLLGGETAEMPEFYRPGEYDLAGFIVGVVEEDRLVDGSRVRSGDSIVALASSGLHTNGYSLARRIVAEMGLKADDTLPGTGHSVADEFLRVHRSYAPALLPLVERGIPRALAHVTGGGIEGNLPRVLPDGLGARIRRGSWPVPCVFGALARGGDVAPEEMARVFNMGAGMLVVVAPEDRSTVLASSAKSGIAAFKIGDVVEGDAVEYL